MDVWNGEKKKKLCQYLLCRTHYASDKSNERPTRGSRVESTNPKRLCVVSLSSAYNIIFLNTSSLGSSSVVRTIYRSFFSLSYSQLCVSSLRILHLFLALTPIMINMIYLSIAFALTYVLYVWIDIWGDNVILFSLPCSRHVNGASDLRKDSHFRLSTLQSVFFTHKNIFKI